MKIPEYHGVQGFFLSVCQRIQFDKPRPYLIINQLEEAHRHVSKLVIGWTDRLKMIGTGLEIRASEKPRIIYPA